MPFTARAIWCTGRLMVLSGLGATSTAKVSAPISMTSCEASHSAAGAPMPGVSRLYLALSTPHSLE